MEENLNIFGKNQGEIGSLDKNLVLRTKGRVYIRYGKKYIELLDDKGNLNVKIPKVLTKVDSEDAMTETGFYLLDGNLYACYEGDIIQITGVDGQYVEYGNSQNLTQEQISTAQQNIGLVFPTTKDAQKAITKGIVFVGDKIYYIDNGKIKEIPLNEPVKGINEAGLDEHPSKDNSAILWVNGAWKYDTIVTKEEFDQYKREQEEDDKDDEEEEDDEVDSIFDPIQYSTVYTLKSFSFDIEEGPSTYGESDPENKKYLTPSASFDTTPVVDMSEGDIAILSVNGFWGTRSGSNIAPDTYDVVKTYEIPLSNFESEDEIRKYAKGLNNEYPDATYVIDRNRNVVTITRTEEELAQGIYTFNLKYKSGKLLFIDSNGEEISYPITKGTYQSQPIVIIDVDGKSLAFKYTNNSFKGKHIYVKAEQNKKEKFKIDYEHAEIALEENYPKNEDGKTEEEKQKPKIIPHTVLGDLDDKSEYYNSPAKSFRTYNEKENSQGLFSDQAVFAGAEFRQPLDYKEPEEPEDPETEVEYDDTEVYNFPRYSKVLNEILCTKHKLEDFEENDPFEDVVPTIRWIKNNSALNKPLSIINETEFDEDIETVTDDDGNEVPIGIVRVGEDWQYMHVVPWETFKKCCDEMKEATKKFTVSWYTAEGTLYTTTQVSNNTTAVPPSTNPTKKHWKFTGWDYDDSPITEDVSIYAEWEYVPPKVYISVSPAYLTSAGGSATVSYYVEWDGDIITEGITVEGTYSNIEYEEDGEAYILDNKVNRDLIIKESSFSVLGKIYFLAKFMGEEGDEEGMGEVTAETVLQQRPAGAIALPDFDLMKFSAEWTNTTTEDMTGVEGWTQQTDGTWKYKTNGDLDVYTHTENTNISIIETKTLDQYGVGFVGDKNMSQYIDSGSDSRSIPDTESPYSTVSNRVTLITRKNYTKVFDSDFNEVTLDTIEAFNQEKGKSLDSGKDVYSLFQYLAWSGDNTSSGGEYTVLNFKKILNEVVRTGQKAIFIYMQFIWAMNYNGTGNFNIAYDIYKLNNEEKGLISPKSEYNFTPEDSSVEKIEVTNNKLTGLHIDKYNTSYQKSEYKDPLATLYYDLSTKEITFIQGYYTEEDIYGKGSSSDTFIWTDED